MLPLPRIRACPGQVRRRSEQEPSLLQVRGGGARGPRLSGRAEVSAVLGGGSPAWPQNGWPSVPAPDQVTGVRKGKGRELEDRGGGGGGQCCRYSAFLVRSIGGSKERNSHASGDPSGRIGVQLRLREAEGPGGGHRKTLQQWSTLRVAHGEGLQDPEEEEEEGRIGLRLGLGLGGPVTALWPGGLLERWRDLIEGFRYRGSRCGGSGGRGGGGDDDQETRLLAESIAMSFGGGPPPLLLLPPRPPPLPPLEGAGTSAGAGGSVMRDADQRGQLSGRPILPLVMSRAPPPPDAARQLQALHAGARPARAGPRGAGCRADRGHGAVPAV